jgi:hypothetical protein
MGDLDSLAKSMADDIPVAAAAKGDVDHTVTRFQIVRA